MLDTQSTKLANHGQSTISTSWNLFGLSLPDFSNFRVPNIARRRSILSWHRPIQLYPPWTRVSGSVCPTRHNTSHQFWTELPSCVGINLLECFILTEIYLNIDLFQEAINLPPVDQTRTHTNVSLEEAASTRWEKATPRPNLPHMDCTHGLYYANMLMKFAQRCFHHDLMNIEFVIVCYCNIL